MSSPIKGNRTPSVPPVKRETRVWASMWCTGIMGTLCSAAILRAFLTPTRRHKLNPGPTVTAIASNCVGSTPASASAFSTIPSMASSWAPCANLGTTPPHGACNSAWDARASPKMRPSAVTTAAPVSSQLLSIPRTMASGRRLPMLYTGFLIVDSASLSALQVVKCVLTVSPVPMWTWPRAPNLPHLALKAPVPACGLALQLCLLSNEFPIEVTLIP
mmetsp:Transcript_28232/g.61871  ORF Transcript_28232/g.61871 Transcript_28232/m.61871 type:complete len:217 (-) Transcript_28232:70-720(-)